MMAGPVNFWAVEDIAKTFDELVARRRDWPDQSPHEVGGGTT